MAVQVNRRLIRELRLRNSYSQERLAEIVGVNLRTIQRIEKDGLASLQTRSDLAKAFGVKPEDLDVPNKSNDLDTIQIQNSRLFPLGITLSVILFAIGVAFASQIGAIFSITGTIGIGTRGIIGLTLLLLSFLLLARRIHLSRWRPYFLVGALAIGLLAAPRTWQAQILVILTVWLVLEISLFLASILRRRMTGSPT